MIQEKVVIRSELGLHARPAAEFVKAAGKLKCSVQLAKQDDEWVNGKSVLGILTLAAEHGDSLLLRIEGERRRPGRAAGTGGSGRDSSGHS